MSTFADELRKSRNESGLTLAEVGASCGLSGGYIANIEHGRKGPPSVDKVASMARAMGAKPALLVMLALHERHSEEEIDVLSAYFQARLGDA